MLELYVLHVSLLDVSFAVVLDWYPRIPGRWPLSVRGKSESQMLRSQPVPQCLITWTPSSAACSPLRVKGISAGSSTHRRPPIGDLPKTTRQRGPPRDDHLTTSIQRRRPKDSDPKTPNQRQQLKESSPKINSKLAAQRQQLKATRDSNPKIAI